MKVRIIFSKTEAMRYTGHLDLHRTWERTLRRSGLPLAYSQGFKPHARINLACALPLGFTSQGDVVDIELDGDFTTQEITNRIEKAAPPGILVESIQSIPVEAPAIQTLLEAQDYIVTFKDRLPDLDQRVSDLMAAESLPRQRRNKSYDLRPLIHEIQFLSPDESGLTRLFLRLSAQEGATGRPEEVILALGGSPTACRVHRVGLIFRHSTEIAIVHP